MKDSTRNAIVGITAMAGIVGIFGMLILFGYLPVWLEGGYKLRVRLSNASGLTEGSRVKLSGIDIGRVTRVELQSMSHEGVIVTTLIREDIIVPKEVRVEAESPLLGGNPTLAFDISHLNPDQSPETLPTDGTAEIRGESLTLVSQFAGEMQAAISEPTKQFKQMVERFDNIATSFENLSEEWRMVGVNLNRLAEPRDLKSVDNGDAVGNLSTVLARTDQRLNELGKIVDGIDGWVNNDELRENVRLTVANARDLTERLKATPDKIDTLVTDAGGHLDRLANRYIALADDMSGAIGSLHQAIDKANTTDGTVGKLLNDPSLYDNLNDSFQRLQKAVTEFRLLIQKWKDEGLPVQF